MRGTHCLLLMSLCPLLLLISLQTFKLFFLLKSLAAELSSAIDKLDRSMCSNQLSLNASNNISRRHSPPLAHSHTGRTDKCMTNGTKRTCRQQKKKKKTIRFIIIGSIARIRNRTTTIYESEIYNNNTTTKLVCITMSSDDYTATAPAAQCCLCCCVSIFWFRVHLYGICI